MLNKIPNDYAVDDVRHRNFACDFFTEESKDKYPDDYESVEQNYFRYGKPSYDFMKKRDKYLQERFYRKNKSDFDKYEKINSKIKSEIGNKLHRESYENNGSKTVYYVFINEPMEFDDWMEFEQYDLVAYEEYLMQDCDDDDFVDHERSIDYDYHYENDCEYDGDEEIYESYGYDDYDEY